MKLIIAGVVALAAAGGAYMIFSGNSDTEGAVEASSSDVSANVNTTSNVINDAGASTAQTVAVNTAATNPAPRKSSNSNPKLHPVKEVCIDYVSSGQMMNGTMTSCHRKWAYERYEIMYSEIGFAGVTQTQHQHTIYIGDTIYAIDLETDTGKETTNPVYAGIASAMENSSPEEMSAEFIAAMNYTPTGEKKRIADTDCNVYSAAQMGTACLTPRGLMLEQDFMGNKQIAVKVSIGDGGDNDNYTLYKNVPLTEGPDLSNGLEGLMEQLGNQ